MDCKAVLQAIEANPAREYQVSLATHSSEWFVTFMTLAKAFKAVESYKQNITKLLTQPSIIKAIKF